MQRQRRPWWTGKAPEWVKEDEEGGAAAPAPTAEPAAALPLPTGVDPRLARLAQRQGPAGRRAPSEAVVVQRHRHRSPEQEEAEHDGGGGGAARRGGRGGSVSPPAQRQEREEEEQEGEEEEEDEEAIAARRLAIRARQLAAEAEAAAASEEEDEGSEDSSEYTTDEDSEDERGPVMLKPAFVPRTERETLAERDETLAQAEQTTRQQEEALEERKRQTQELVAQAALQEARQEAAPDEEAEFDTDDEKDEVEQYEAWRERELKRIARDRQLRQAGTKVEAAAAAAPSLPPPPVQPKKKWKFLQKYWHKGAFFQTEDHEGESVLGDIMHRSYDAPTGEDRVDKEMLPKIMQVRNFGRRGRVKHTHLLAEDTTMLADPNVALPPVEARQRAGPSAHAFSKPKQLRT
ncbi:hypothetical protein ABPG75_000040 [Micractinium tetrahymenae]